jgi:hypothetical protein
MMHRYFSTVSEDADDPILIYNVVPWSYGFPEQACELKFDT